MGFEGADLIVAGGLADGAAFALEGVHLGLGGGEATGVDIAAGLGGLDPAAELGGLGIDGGEATAGLVSG